MTKDAGLPLKPALGAGVTVTSTFGGHVTLTVTVVLAWLAGLAARPSALATHKMDACMMIDLRRNRRRDATLTAASTMERGLIGRVRARLLGRDDVRPVLRHQLQHVAEAVPPPGVDLVLLRLREPGLRIGL